MDRFKKNIAENSLFSKEDKILLAVSGGRDSMVMLDLFQRAGFHFGIAHANFHLRAEDANGDQKFVKRKAVEHSIPFHTVDFDTFSVAKEDSISIEMAARNLRYEWFELLLKEYKYKYVATAHHADDVVETFHLNLLRATGLEGLTGIKAKKANIIRPILYMYRSEINDYVEIHKIAYREDYTNSETDILRNKFRLQIIPEIQKIQVNYPQQVVKTVGFLNQANNFIKNQMNSLKEALGQKTNLYTQLDFSAYLHSPDLLFILFEILREYEFESTQIENLRKALQTSEMAYFESKNYRFTAEKAKLYIQNKNIYVNIFLVISKIDNQLFLPDPFNQKIVITRLKKTNFILDKNPNIAFFDISKLNFPLHLRNWKSGDYFYPLGMKGRKKLSDFFIDLKFNYFEKKASLVLEDSDEQIVWVFGKRIDERVKVRKSTKDILKIEILEV